MVWDSIGGVTMEERVGGIALVIEGAAADAIVDLVTVAVMYHPRHTLPVRSRAFPFILRYSFMFLLFSVSLLSRSVPFSVTPSYFHFRLWP